MINNIPYFNTGNYIGIPSVDGIPLTPKQAKYAEKVVARAHDTTQLYAEGGLLKSKSDMDETLPFKPIKVGNSEILFEGDLVQLRSAGKVWMTTGVSSLNQLFSQYDDAKGDVLIAGLGLGVLALLLAFKPTVKSITVLEIEQDIIDMFESQGFTLPNVTILKESVYDHKGKYDCALFDYYNEQANMTDFIMSENEKLTSIESPIRNYYLWETAFTSYEVYSAVEWLPARTKAEYASLVETHYSAAPTKDLTKAIKAVTKKLEVNKPFSLATIAKGFAATEALVMKRFNKIIGTSALDRDYCIYREFDDHIMAYGVTWKFEGKVYSAKAENGVITDLYEIYEDNRSAEIDMKTHEVINMYENKGATKTDKNGNIVQVNYKVKSQADIPLTLKASLKAVRFPYLGGVFYWADKPYGRVVEFTDGMF